MAQDKNGKRVWSMQSLERAEHHNGHSGNSTQHGILASKCCGSWPHSDHASHLDVLYNYDRRFARVFCDLIRDEIFTSSKVRGWL
jgi:hypothetical protein